MRLEQQYCSCLLLMLCAFHGLCCAQPILSDSASMQDLLLDPSQTVRRNISHVLQFKGARSQGTADNVADGP